MTEPLGSNTPVLAPAEQDGQVSCLATEGFTTRADVLKHVVGPAMTRLLEPVYQPTISDAEAAHIPSPRTFEEANAFAGGLKRILRGRFLDMGLNDEPDYLLLDSMAMASKFSERRIFTFNAQTTIEEGLASSVVVPLTLAAQINRAEAGTTHCDDPSALALNFDSAAICSILRRPSFDRMLLRLAKGPNGFLGQRAVSPLVHEKRFFDFYIRGKGPLLLDEAFDLQAGAVADLSDSYHVAAQAKRRQMLTERRQAMINLLGKQRADFYFAPSSGCPVRHEFQDPEIKAPKPLILTAKDFLVAALDFSSRQEGQRP